LKYWLLKTEPDVFSLDDLKRLGTDAWDGVRNYQARNNLTAMKPGDLGLFYHSRTAPPHVAGLCRVSKVAYPDPTAFDPKAKYFDSKSDPEKPRWFCPEVSYLCHFPQMVSLHDIKAVGHLSKMALVNNTRLSVQPVTAAQFRRVCKMGGLDDIPSK
jgi:predicted RNA-binding protein with PUA-like domain